jgi:SNF2 family DNA or RNA helicase
VDLAKNLPGMGLLLPPGLGKTTTTLTIVAEHFTGKTLVIAPKKVAESVWAQEADKWEHLRHLHISRVLGTEPQRITALKGGADVYVINQENVAWLCEHPAGFMDQFDNLVIDESSRFKDASTKRFKALKKYLRHFKRKVILTGTPTPQGLGDLWAQVAILDLGQRLGRSLTAFRDRYMQPVERNRHTGMVYKWGIRPGMDVKIHDAIRDICFSLRAEDYLTMPKLTQIYHNVPIDPATWKNYRKLAKDMAIETNGETITAITAAALVNKLQQFTSGFLYTEDKTPIRQHEEKVDYLEQILDENTPTLLFYHYKESLASIQARFPHARLLTNDQDILDFNNGKVPLLLTHPMSGGIGLNLQCNTADTAQLVWFDMPWSSQDYIQANARIYRQGQEKPVIIHHLIIPKTIDQQAKDVVENKINVQQAVLNALDCALLYP